MGLLERRLKMAKGVDEGYLSSFRDIGFKFLSNIVQMKTWIITVASIALFGGLLSEVTWVAVVSLVYGAGKAVKQTWLKTLMGNSTTPADSGESFSE
jgi:hypothetical protein